MIKNLYVDNFKSLVNFRLPGVPHDLGSFSVLVGLNGAGKSTVLQALDFIGQLATGSVDEWLKAREWKAPDLVSRMHAQNRLIRFELRLALPGSEWMLWRGNYNVVLGRCTREEVKTYRPMLSLDDGELSYLHRDPDHGEETPRTKIPAGKLNLRGSTLSLLREDAVCSPLRELKRFAASLRSLDMLSPQLMRRRAKEGSDIGRGGERLSAYIHAMASESKRHLNEQMHAFYPNLLDVSTKALRSGWKDLQFLEHFGGPKERGSLLSSARHISDGLLRVLAVLAELSGSKHRGGCILFDEIENGINPELVQRLVEHLQAAPQQVMVTTHSPLILNYLPDEVAQTAVHLIYRNSHGYTRAARLFDLPSAKERLDLLGPGEVFVDLDLQQLPLEAENLDRENAGAVAAQW